ncbi:MAG: hypothetical protein J7M25_07855 [Deltaproteobacteria bacterium]|nr:hypothetical protein [Deltaproteobacteria bacterium]
MNAQFRSSSAGLLAILLGGIAVLVVAFAVRPDDARAQTPGGVTQLVLGIYCPNAKFGGSGARWGYINRVAKHVANITGIPTKGRAFGSSGSFGGSLGRLDFAVVDPIYLCRHRGRLRVLLTGRMGGGSRASWALFARSSGGVMGLRGKRLIVAQASGAETSFAEGMFYGQIAVSKFFSRVKRAPDLASAVAAVRGGSADAVFAPTSMGGGLSRVFSAGSVPNAGFVLVRRSLPGALVSKVRAAVRGYGAGGVGGWGGAGGYSCRFGRRHFSMASVRPRPVRFSGASVLRLRFGMDFSLQDVQKYYWRP